MQMCNAKIAPVSLFRIVCLKETGLHNFAFFFFFTGLLTFIPNTGWPFHFVNVFDRIGGGQENFKIWLKLVAEVKGSSELAADTQIERIGF